MINDKILFSGPQSKIKLSNIYLYTFVREIRWPCHTFRSLFPNSIDEGERYSVESEERNLEGTYNKEARDSQTIKTVCYYPLRSIKTTLTKYIKLFIDP